MSLEFLAHACKHDRMYPICLDCFKELESENARLRNQLEAALRIAGVVKNIAAIDESEISNVIQRSEIIRWAREALSAAEGKK